MAEPILSIEQQVTEGALHVRAIGEVDVSNEPTLRQPLMAAVADPQKRAVTLDLRQVGFMDSAAMALLMEAHKRLAQQGRVMTVLVRPESPPDLVLRKFRFDRVLHTVS